MAEHWGLQVSPSAGQRGCHDLSRCWGPEGHVLLGAQPLGWHRLKPLVILVAITQRNLIARLFICKKTTHTSGVYNSYNVYNSIRLLHRFLPFPVTQQQELGE